MDEHFFIYNNQFFPAETPVISATSRALRYGDGLFETMRMYRGKIINETFHFERLYHGMELLRFTIPQLFSKEFLIQKIKELLKKNGHPQNARIRLMIFRDEGELFSAGESHPKYLIESWPLPETMELNSNGLIVNIFPDARKSQDIFSNLKSNNYLHSAMAAIYAKEHRFNDAIILNTSDRVCETSIANIFIIKENQIWTPPLSEGCVAGTMRRFLLEKKSLSKFSIGEKSLSMKEILSADEVFLTNAIYPIRWVKQIGESSYDSQKVFEIFKEMLPTL